VRRGRVRDAVVAIASGASVFRLRGRADLGELHVALSSLREVFVEGYADTAVTDDQREALALLAVFAAERIGVIERAIDGSALGATSQTSTVDNPTDGTAAIIERAGAELDEAAGLLELVERSTENARTQVGVATLAEQALRLAWAIRAQSTINVHVLPAVEDCSVSCDPHVVARALAIAIATVRGSAQTIVVKTHVEADAGVLEVTGATDGDEGAPIIQTRLVQMTTATEAILKVAAAAAGLGLAIEPGRVLIRCPRAF
jgi:hypothetical protein